MQAHVNGAIVAERAAALPLPADTVREGEVLDEGALSETLRELFGDGGLSKRVRIGVANQRTVLRTLELPPITDRKELDAAVRFQAQEQVPMPLNNAVLDFHPLGVHDTPEGRASRSCSWPPSATWSRACSRRCATPACARRASISPPSP